MKSIQVILLLASCFLLIPQAYAQGPSWIHGQSERVYKWEDDRGEVQYTRYPPRDRTYEEVERSYPVASDAGEADADTASADTAEEKSDKPLTPDEQVSQNCITATNNLALLQDPQTLLSYQDNEGKTVSIDKKAREEQIARARKNIAEFCK